MSIEEKIKQVINCEIKCDILCDCYEGAIIYTISNLEKEKKGKKVLITAGAHAEELAGIEGVLKVIPYIESVNFCVIPTRDPLGNLGMKHIEGIEPNRTYMFDLKKFKVRVMEYMESYYIEVIDNVYLDILDLIKLCKIFDAYVKFKIFVPIILCIAYDKQNNIDRVHTVYINEERKVKDYNTDFFSSNEKSISSLRKLIEKEKFELIIDCHEGYGSGMYLYVNERDEKFFLNIINKLEKRNVLINYEKSCRGYIVKNKGTSLQDYATKLNATAVTIETGSLDSMEKRVNDLVSAIILIVGECLGYKL